MTRNITPAAAREMERANAALAQAGIRERWEIDTDPESNSRGTAFLGDAGGVTLVGQVRAATRRLLNHERRMRVEAIVEIIRGVRP